jgi:hypothetical protein
MNSMQSGVLEILKRALAGLPVSEQQAAFAYLEQRAKRESNLAALRALRKARMQFPFSTPRRRAERHRRLESDN